jgi:hypothetical protein
MKASKKIVVFKVLAFACLIVAVDFLTSKILGHLYRTAPAGDIKEISYALEKSSEPIVIMGSSRARHHYSPDVFNDSLHSAAFNAGMNGQGIFYHYCILTAILKRYNPKVVVLDLTPKDLVKSQDFGLDALSQLYPFYGLSSKFDQVLELENWSKKIKLQSGLYKYNSTIADILSSRLIKPDIRSGYKPLFGNSVSEKKIDQYHEATIDSLKLSYIHKFITEAQEENVKVFLVTSPSFIQSESNSFFLSTISDIAYEHNVPLISAEKYQDSFDAKVFKDPSHLNHHGAEKWSSLVSSMIKQSL